MLPGSSSLAFFIAAALALLVTPGPAVYAFAAGACSGGLRGNERFWKAQGYASGGVYLTLGVASLVSLANARETRS